MPAFYSGWVSNQCKWPGVLRKVKSAALLLLAAVILGCWWQSKATSRWNPETGAFRWWAGAVHLPPGYTYLPLGGDSDYGELTSPDGATTLWHDIGSYAGLWADQKGAIAFSESRVDGARVWVAVRERSRPDGMYHQIAVSFPDSGSANFYLWTQDPQRDARIIHGIASSFRPMKPPADGAAR